MTPFPSAVVTSPVLAVQIYQPLPIAHALPPFITRLSIRLQRVNHCLSD